MMNRVPENGKMFGPFHFFGAIFFSMAGFGLLMSRFGVPPFDSAKFLAGLLAGVYIPGEALCSLLRLKITRLERFTVAIILGMTASTLIYRIAGLTGALWIFWAWLVLAGLVLAARLVSSPPARSSFTYRVTWTGAGFIALAAVLLVLLSVDNFRNGITLPDGSVRLHMRYYDGFTRNNLVRELSHSIPPQMPFAAGLPISYHYDMNLFVSVFYKYLGLDVLDLLHRFTITFYFGALYLAVFVFLRRWTRSGGMALFGVALSVFGSGGLGWALALLSGYGGLWGKPFYSFYYLDLVSINPMLPALAVIVTGMFGLLMYFETRAKSWLFLSAYFLAVLTAYKMPLSLPVLGALAGAAVLFLLRRKDVLFLWTFLATSLATAPFLVAAYVLNTGGPGFTGKILFSNWIIFSLVDMKWMTMATAWTEFLKFTGLTLKTVSLALWSVLIFILGSFGVSAAALPSLASRTLGSRTEDRMTAFLGFLAAASCAVFFFVNPFLGERTRNWILMDAFKLAAFVMLLYAPVWLAGIFRKKSGLLAAAAMGLFLFSVPTTVQFVHVKRTAPSTMIMDAHFLEATRFLNASTESDAVVLHSQNVLFVCYFSDRRVVLDSAPHSYLDFHLLPEQQEERYADIARFFASPSEAGDVLDKYGVGYVWAKKRVDTTLWAGRLPERIPIWVRPGEKEPGERQLSHELKLVFSNFRYALYKVVRAGSALSIPR
ncbi:MAG: hypothetical protein A2W03_17640 [Candidatus Aminicenantes bacterium RBG_16_63_16]|nr:MAG: hypothetical protein A2W03_17640 [Candidatus Aminicenantes bacterium RBG_16_63_16]